MSIMKVGFAKYTERSEVDTMLDKIRAENSVKTDGDLISRQAVEDAIAETIVNGESLGYSVAYDILSDIPSAKTNGDLISRTDLLNKIWQKEYGKDYDGVNLLNIPHIDIIEQMPSAENTAEWINKNISDWECSNCGTTFYVIKKPFYIFCPNCGARMKAESEEGATE